MSPSQTVGNNKAWLYEGETMKRAQSSFNMWMVLYQVLEALYRGSASLMVAIAIFFLLGLSPYTFLLWLLWLGIWFILFPYVGALFFGYIGGQPLGTPAPLSSRDEVGLAIDIAALFLGGASVAYLFGKHDVGHDSSIFGIPATAVLSIFEILKSPKSDEEMILGVLITLSMLFVPITWIGVAAFLRNKLKP